MRISLPALLALSAFPLSAQAQTAPAPVAAPAPVVVVSPVAPPREPPTPLPALVHYDAASVRCGTIEQRASLAVTPFETISWQGEGIVRKPVIFAFRIDAEGRPLSIARVGDASDFMPEADDLAPALAASRFPAGQPLQGCIATYTPGAAPIATAPKDQLYRYYGMPHRAGPFDRQAFDAIKPAPSTCAGPTPQPRTLNYPDYGALPQAAGTSSFVVLGYDIDAGGQPVNLRVLASEGNASLDRAAKDAVAASRFEPGVRTGCMTRFYRRQNAPTKAPPMPNIATFKIAGGQCPGPAVWAEMPTLTFPEPYNRRAIEGWAIIAYDVATWGATGNLRVLASEPTADFGKAAMPIVARARRPANAHGLTGCVAPVRFILPGDFKPAGTSLADEPIILH